MSPRLASAPSSQGAGSLAAADSYSKTLRSGSLQFVTQTSAGNFNGTRTSVQYKFDWTAPAAGSGGVTFYVAALAGSQNYSSSLSVPEALTAPAPVLRTSSPALPAFLGAAQNGIASNGYLEIYGTDLAGTTRMWTGADFTGSNAPTQLDGVQVKINGKPLSCTTSARPR